MKILSIGVAFVLVAGAGTTAAAKKKASSGFSVSIADDKKQVVLEAGAQSRLSVNVGDSSTIRSAAQLKLVGLPSGVDSKQIPTKSGFDLVLQATDLVAASSSSVSVVVTSKGRVQNDSFKLQINSQGATETASLSAGSPNLQDPFQLTIDPQNVSLFAGNESRHAVFVQGSDSSNRLVRFSAKGLPSGIVASFVPESSRYGTIVVLSSTLSAAPGISKVQIVGTSRDSSASVDISFEILSDGTNPSTATVATSPSTTPTPPYSPNRTTPPTTSSTSPRKSLAQTTTGKAATTIAPARATIGKPATTIARARTTTTTTTAKPATTAATTTFVPAPTTPAPVVTVGTPPTTPAPALVVTVGTPPTTPAPALVVTVGTPPPTTAPTPVTTAVPNTTAAPVPTTSPVVVVSGTMGIKPTLSTTGPRGALTAMSGGGLAGSFKNVKISGTVTPTGPLTLTDCWIDGNIAIYSFPITLDHCYVNGYVGLVTDNTDPNRSMLTARFSRFDGPSDNDAMHLGAHVWNDNSKYLNTVIEDSIIYSPYVPSPGDHADVIQFGGGRNSAFRRVVISMRNQAFNSSLTNYLNNGTQNPGVVFDSLWVEGGPMGFVLGGPMAINNCILARSTAHYGYIYPDGDGNSANDPQLSKCFDEVGTTIK